MFKVGSFVTALFNVSFKKKMKRKATFFKGWFQAKCVGLSILTHSHLFVWYFGILWMDFV